jgi:hypothetical protein
VVGDAAQALFCDDEIKKQLLLMDGRFVRVYGTEGGELAAALAENEQGSLSRTWTSRPS